MAFNSGVTPKCNSCGNRKIIGNTNGMPNMVGFQMENGKIINLCCDCLIKVGAMSDEDKDKFFEEIQK